MRLLAANIATDRRLRARDATVAAVSGVPTFALMTDRVPAGFYPDPDNKEIQRYWDGNIWTNLGQRPDPHTADGWYLDPVDKRLERQWGGGLWTNNVRYARIHDARVTVRKRGIGYEMLRLLATVEGIRWRERRHPLGSTSPISAKPS